MQTSFLTPGDTDTFRFALVFERSCHERVAASVGQDWYLRAFNMCDTNLSNVQINAWDQVLHFGTRSICVAWKAPLQAIMLHTHTSIPQLFCYLVFIFKITLLALRVRTSRTPFCVCAFSCSLYALLELIVLRLVNVNS